MNDYILLFVFFGVSIACFIIYSKSIKEQKKWINLYARKFKTDTYEEAMAKLQKRPLFAPVYSLRQSIFWFYMLFKKIDDQELSYQAQRVKGYFYLILLLVLSLLLFIVIYGVFFV